MSKEDRKRALGILKRAALFHMTERDLFESFLDADFDYMKRAFDGKFVDASLPDPNKEYVASASVTAQIKRAAIARIKSAQKGEDLSKEYAIIKQREVKMTPLVCLLEDSTRRDKMMVKSCFNLLLSKGADINQESMGKSPVKMLFSSGIFSSLFKDKKETKSIFDKIDWNKKIAGKTPAEYLFDDPAASTEAKLEAAARTKDFQSLLVPAIASKDERLTKAVLSRGADINQPDANGVRPLDAALSLTSDKEKMVSMIMDKKPNTSYKSPVEFQDTILKDHKNDNASGLRLMSKIGITPSQKFPVKQSYRNTESFKRIAAAKTAHYSINSNISAALNAKKEKTSISSQKQNMFTFRSPRSLQLAA